ncbi:hypothetical protein HK102_010995 [Quaeritorhiza haematococci]|nr:hypothetical protein HK102_010995 [Quaeritorhiza haematococci]
MSRSVSKLKFLAIFVAFLLSIASSIAAQKLRVRRRGRDTPFDQSADQHTQQQTQNASPPSQDDSDSKQQIPPQHQCPQISNAKTWMSTGDFFDSTHGSWTGRLIFPATPADRQPDGSVLFEVYSSPKNVQLPPQSQQEGKSTSGNPIISIVIDQEDGWGKEFYERTTTDIDVNKAPEGVRKKIEENQVLVLPKRTYGLERVSPLETLAGARNDEYRIGGTNSPDTIEVLITGPTRFIDNKLHITKEPVQIIGRSVALVKVIDAIDAEQQIFKAQHFDKQTNTFCGAVEIIHFRPRSRSGLGSSFKNILDSPHNTHGLYIFGEPPGEPNPTFTFEVRGIEPRALYSLNPLIGPRLGEIRNDQKKQVNYIKYKTWKDERKKKNGWSTLGLVNQEGGEWVLDDRGLVMHLFGGNNGPMGRNGAIIPFLGQVNTGHFAFGSTRVILDPITSELRHDITYHQVYAHNREGIVSGFHKYCAYMGDVERGVAYHLPVSDVVFKHPILTHEFVVVVDKKESANENQQQQQQQQQQQEGEQQVEQKQETKRFIVLDQIIQELSVMVARYRSGDGTGLSDVTAYGSCVQDSNFAIYAAIKDVEALLKNYATKKRTGLFSTTTVLPLQNPEKDEPLFQTLKSLVDSYERHIIRKARYRTDWRRNIASLHINEKYDVPLFGFRAILRALISRNILVPRWNFDALAGILLRRGASGWHVRTSFLGANVAGLIPASPMFDRTARKKDYEGDGMGEAEAEAELEGNGGLEKTENDQENDA